MTPTAAKGVVAEFANGGFTTAQPFASFVPIIGNESLMPTEYVARLEAKLAQRKLLCPQPLLKKSA